MLFRSHKSNVWPSTCDSAKLVWLASADQGEHRRRLARRSRHMWSGSIRSSRGSSRKRCSRDFLTEEFNLRSPSLAVGALRPTPSREAVPPCCFRCSRRPCYVLRYFSKARTPWEAPMSSWEAPMSSGFSEDDSQVGRTSQLSRSVARTDRRLFIQSYGRAYMK